MKIAPASTDVAIFWIENDKSQHTKFISPARAEKVLLRLFSRKSAGANIQQIMEVTTYKFDQVKRGVGSSKIRKARAQ